jgi:nucleoid DNA-binding protein
MIRRGIIDEAQIRHPGIFAKDPEVLANVILDTRTQNLARDRRIELRGLVSFGVKLRRAPGAQSQHCAPVAVRRTPFFPAAEQFRARSRDQAIGESESPA